MTKMIPGALLGIRGDPRKHRIKSVFHRAQYLKTGGLIMPDKEFTEVVKKRPYPVCPKNIPLPSLSPWAKNQQRIDA